MIYLLVAYDMSYYSYVIAGNEEYLINIIPTRDHDILPDDL